MHKHASSREALYCCHPASHGAFTFTVSVCRCIDVDLQGKECRARRACHSPPPDTHAVSYCCSFCSFGDDDDKHLQQGHFYTTEGSLLIPIVIGLCWAVRWKYMPPVPSYRKRPGVTERSRSFSRGGERGFCLVVSVSRSYADACGFFDCMNTTGHTRSVSDKPRPPHYSIPDKWMSSSSGTGCSMYVSGKAEYCSQVLTAINN